MAFRVQGVPGMIPLLVVLSGICGNCTGPAKTYGPFFGNGYHNGWADQHSVVIWTRLTAEPEMNRMGAPFIPLGSGYHHFLDSLGNRDSILKAQIPDSLTLKDMEGACPGAPGFVRLSWWPMEGPVNVEETGWVPVDTRKNFTTQWKLDHLLPGTRYGVKILASPSTGGPVSDTVTGTFVTPPPGGLVEEVRFCIVTCHDFNRRNHPGKGHRIYPAMLGTVPDFYVHTGDVEYYDKENPWAMTEELMRFKWDRLFALPYQRNFFTRVTTYFMKDDHDVLRDDCYPGMRYGTVSFERGLEIFDREQFPSNDLPYKTIRWGRDLQIWLMEGRNFRSPNTLPDGPEKTIWGREQKAWLFSTLDASDATYKLIISPTPILGPDRSNKADNYANESFRTEGDEIREFVNRHDNVYLCNGDRHWQYVSHVEGTRLWEFGCGAGSDEHAGGWSGDDRRPEHRFLRVKGGFLAGKVTRLDDYVVLTFQHCDVYGNVIHEENFRKPIGVMR